MSIIYANFIDAGENCVLLNSVQEFIKKEAWLLLTFFTHNQLSLIILLSYIKEYRCLKKVIHQIDRK